MVVGKGNLVVINKIEYLKGWGELDIVGEVGFS